MRDPGRRARLFAAGGLRRHGVQPARGEGRAQPWPHAASRTGRGARRRAASAAVGDRSRTSFRLCRAFQRAGFRRHPCHDRRRRPARARQQDAVERQGGGVALFRQLRQGRRLAPGAGSGGRASGDPGVRPERAGGAAEIFHAGRLVCGEGRDHPGLPPCSLCDRGRRLLLVRRRPTTARSGGGRIRHW